MLGQCPAMVNCEGFMKLVSSFSFSKQKDTLGFDFAKGAT